jgi:predicted metalloprotease with PDZ domain
MKLYYDHGQLMKLRCLEGSELETVTLLRRLEAVTKGCQVQEMQLRRKPTGQLGFHLHEEGVVTDVEMYGSAWQTGLRQGSRIVEVLSEFFEPLTRN